MRKFHYLPLALMLVVGLFIATGSSKVAVGASFTPAFTIDPYPWNVRPLRMEEHVAKDSFASSNLTVTGPSSKHVLQIIFSAAAEESSTTGGTTTSTTTTGGSTAGATAGGQGFAGTNRMRVFIQSTTGASGSTTGGTTTGGTYTTSQEYIFVPDGEEFGKIPESPNTVPTAAQIKFSANGTPINGMKYLWVAGYHYPVHIVSSNPNIPAGTVYVGFITVVQTWNSSNQVIHEDVSSWYGTYDLARTALSDSGIDSRKTYGQPNREGQLPGDANALPRPTNFGDWIYKGGLFAGFMPFTTGDLSGLARTQLYAASATHSNTQLATVVLLDTGTRSNLSTVPITLGAFCPAAGDTNINTTESNVTWTTRWSITPRTTPSDPPDPTQDPTETVTFSGAATNYGSWNLCKVTTSSVTMPTTGLTRICIAMHDEPNMQASPMWRYFGSKEYQPLFSTYPNNDSAPRLWVLDITSTQLGAYRVF
jgi:hypothetical protein